MPSAGLLSLLCSCLLSTPSPDAKLALNVVPAQPLTEAPVSMSAARLIWPTYFSAITGQLLLGQQPAQAQPANQDAAVATAAGGGCAVAGWSPASGSQPPGAPSLAAGALAQALPDAPVISLPGQIGTVFERPLIRYTNIPVEYLDAASPIDRVAAVISSNEGAPTAIDWNDNGKGVSVGIFQANQRVGELPQLLHQLAVIPQGQQEIAGAFGKQAAQQITQHPEVIRQWRFSPQNTLGHGLKRLVHSSLFQKLQVSVLRRNVTKAAAVAANYGLTSAAGVAVCADLTNQWGHAGAKRFLKAADTMHSQGGKVNAIVMAVTKGSQYGSRYQTDLQKFQGDGLSLNEPFILQPYGDATIVNASFMQ